MALNPRLLDAWLSPGLRAPSLEAVSLPVLREVLYAHPNADRTRKQCGNCVLWKQAGEQCAIHDGDVIATATMACGYHVHGTPAGHTLVTTNTQPVDPDMSGLQPTLLGAACDTCEHYEKRGSLSGVCRATSDAEVLGAQPVVASLGHCTRWSGLA